MPPPRAILTLRPCYPSWSACQVRWSSNGPDDNGSSLHGDPTTESTSKETSQPSDHENRPFRQHRTETKRRRSSHFSNPDLQKGRTENGILGGATLQGKPVERLTRQINVRSKRKQYSLRSEPDLQEGRISEDCDVGSSIPQGKLVPSEPTPDELNARSLLYELFPEAASAHVQPQEPVKRSSYPKLELPSSTIPLIRRVPLKPPKSRLDRVAESFQSDQVTVLQLAHCSTGLSEADFRRISQKGKHINTWMQDDELYKIIPGRDPISLERLPFYYLLFKSAKAALKYQATATRLHRLNNMHQPSNILSAVPLPSMVNVQGEELNTQTSSYLLKPAGTPMTLNVVMQPYNPFMRALIDQGGYKPIVPSTNDIGKPIYKVLMHIEGYEPSHWDLWQIFARHAHERGIVWPFHNETCASAIHRLRDAINIKKKLVPVTSANAHASASSDPHVHDEESYNLSSNTADGTENSTAQLSPVQMNQFIMNRVYNRWIIEFEEEDAARRFAVMWHRKVLPDVLKEVKPPRAYGEVEEMRVCNCEFLW